MHDDLEKEFREEVSKNLGFKKGNLQIAIEEAIKEWIAKHRKELIAETKDRKKLEAGISDQTSLRRTQRHESGTSKGNSQRIAK